MIVALIDNGSLEPAAHLNLRSVARALTARTGVLVHPVSWKHSDRVDPAALNDAPAWVLTRFVRSMVALGQREFLFAPFFVSAQGAIGSALRGDLERLQADLGGFSFKFARGLAETGSITPIVVARIRETVAARRLSRPPVVVVDHGGPSPASAALRDQIAGEVRRELGPDIGPLAAASMEGAAHLHNFPLLAEQLVAPGFDRGDVVVAPLFLSPGRHAGPEGDLATIAQTAEKHAASPPLRCHFTELIGTHPMAVAALADSLQSALTPVPTSTFA